jgi:hypothetical protein
MASVISAGVAVSNPVFGLSGIHDFSFSVNPMIIDVNQSGIGHMNVDVILGLMYDNDITLRSGSESSSIHFQFEPQIIKHRSKSTSNVTISVDKDVSPGEQPISIVFDGSDGREHICNLILNVSVPIPTPTYTLPVNPVPKPVQSISPGTQNAYITDSSRKTAPVIDTFKDSINSPSYNNSPSYINSNINSPFSNSNISNSPISSPININSNNKP